MKVYKVERNMIVDIGISIIDINKGDFLFFEDIILNKIQFKDGKIYEIDNKKSPISRRFKLVNDKYPNRSLRLSYMKEGKLITDITTMFNRDKTIDRILE